MLRHAHHVVNLVIGHNCFDELGCIREATLDPAATAEAQPRDNTAARALTAVPITVNRYNASLITVF